MLVPFRGNGLSFGNPSLSFGDPITSSKGVAGSIAVDGVTYTRIYFGGSPLACKFPVSRFTGVTHNDYHYRE